MIVRPAAGSLHLITQPDHAALARRVMEHWETLQHAKRRASILLAIEEHDNGWREPDAAPLVNPSTGRVYDFVDAPADVRQAVWPRGVARLSNDPWAAALVAQHALTVYDRHRTDASWADFFSVMEATRDELVGATSQTPSDLSEDYPYVRIGDLISLIFCNRWQEELAYSGSTFRLDGTHVVVTPDGFAGRVVPMDISARGLPDRSFASDAELRAALAAAPCVPIAGTCGGSNAPPRAEGTIAARPLT